MTPEQIAAKLIPSKSILNRHESCQTVAELRAQAAAVIREGMEPLQREIDDLRSQRDAAIRELERLSDDFELGPVPQGERKTITVKCKQAGRIEPLPYPEDE